MNDPSQRVFPIGENALTIEFGNAILESFNDRALSLADYFVHNPFPGFIESLPAYASATIFYDLVKVRQNFPEFATAFDAVNALVKDASDNLAGILEKKTRLIQIPVDFREEFAPDLNLVKETNHLTRSEVIEIFTSKTYRVYMIGFLPGFAYMGEVDERIATPRKKTPRLRVPKGSVGIAGAQTGVYPFESPGGWQIIGKTETELFTPNDEIPCLFRAGDSVRFVEVKPRS